MLTYADVYTPACAAEVKNTPDITRMHINGNNLRVVPPDVKFLTQVTVMTMDSNEIKSISPDLAQLTQLTELRYAFSSDCLFKRGSIRQHTSAYVSIRQHTSAYVRYAFSSDCLFKRGSVASYVPK
jgi:hypothetical protein